MTITKLPFDQLEKNKWNGIIHYAPNGNVFGYHWYLKSIIKEWDILIEGDYQSVMPIPNRKLTNFEKQLLPQLGPYSVNPLTRNRVNEFYTQWQSFSKTEYYPFNERITSELYGIDQSLEKSVLQYIDLSKTYEDQKQTYTDDTLKGLSENETRNLIYGSSSKPEIFLEKEKLNTEELNCLYRLFYNAIQRGVGWSLEVEDKDNNKYAKSFFIGDSRSITQIYSCQSNDIALEFQLLDMLINSNSGRPIRLLLNAQNPALINHFEILKSDHLLSPEKNSSILDRFKSLF